MTAATLGSIWINFKPQIEGIDREKFTIVAWDPPGYGKSRPPEREFPPNFHERDADCAFQLMKELNIPKYSVLGWCGSAIMSMVFAAKYPDVVDKLVLICPRAFILPHEFEMYKKLEYTLWPDHLRIPTIALYGEDITHKILTDFVNYLDWIHVHKNGDYCSANLKDIKCPTLIFYGEKDPVVDSSHVSYIHAHVQGSRIHLYPDGKHAIHLKYAEDFNKRVEEFILEGNN